jgi:hypothetical protein
MPVRTTAAQFFVGFALLGPSAPANSMVAVGGHGSPPVPSSSAAATSQQHKWTVDLIEAEYKTVKHPEKEYFAIAMPWGLRMRFTNKFGDFATYDFPKPQFPRNEPVYLLSKGLPDLLPVKVTLITVDDYRIEWLADSPRRTPDMKIAESR